MSSEKRKPRAIRIESLLQPVEKPAENRSKPAAARKPRSITRNDESGTRLEILPDTAVNGAIEAMDPPLPAPAKRRFSWATLLVAALGGLVSLAVGLAVDQLVRDLFARNTWLGWAAAALAGLVVLSALAITIREISGIMRLSAIHKLREQALSAWSQDDDKAARAVIRHVETLYSSRPETAMGRAELARHHDEILDGRDRIELGERHILLPLDATARRLVMDSAKRVSVVTAVSPRALVDLAFVLIENMRLIRRLSELYGGRPGTLGFLRLARDVLTHLAATGAIALGDGLMQQLVGHGLAARLSARLGEGVVNGLLTARIGIAAIDVCRPLPFMVARRPGISDFLGELVKFGEISKVPENVQN
ncbi:MAG: TIGR01620 family protein [Nitratireductor sp.]